MKLYLIANECGYGERDDIETYSRDYDTLGIFTDINKAIDSAKRLANEKFEELKDDIYVEDLSLEYDEVFGFICIEWLETCNYKDHWSYFIVLEFESDKEGDNGHPIHMQ